MEENPIIKLVNISKRYNRGAGKVLAVQDVSLAVNPGELIVINGTSGSGKSTLLMIMAAMLRPTSGQVWLQGKEITKLTMRQACAVRKKTVSIVLPTLELIPYLRAIDNVQLADAEGCGQARAAEVLGMLGLDDRVQHLPNQLSTGEQRRVLVARSLLNSPQLLLCDEPTSNLDKENARLIREALIAAKQQGMTVVVVTHEDADLYAADRIFSMQQGKLCQAIESSQPAVSS
jgi:putative ABC transport system ATP-binding protein